MWLLWTLCQHLCHPRLPLRSLQLILISLLHKSKRTLANIGTSLSISSRRRTSASLHLKTEHENVKKAGAIFDARTSMVHAVGTLCPFHSPDSHFLRMVMERIARGDPIAQ